MSKLKVTRENVRRANRRMTCKDAGSREKLDFVPSYKLPEFEYDKEKVRAAWSRVLSAGV